MTAYVKAGLKLKRWRDRNDLSLKAAGKKLGVGYRTIHRFENGHEINATTYLKLAAFVEKANWK